MQIANPIYDVVFKYLMEDSKIAKLIISSIIGEEIEELNFMPQEFVEVPTAKNKKSKVFSRARLTVYRLDFSAKIKTPEGFKHVIIELQKAKFSTDIMRFRRYLGKQFSNKENVQKIKIGNRIRTTGIPIISIYFLGHKLDHTTASVIQVSRQYKDLITGKIIDVKESFIESLTLDSYVIQIPFLAQKRRNDLEILLSIFDQSNPVDDEKHILNIREEDFPDKYRPIIRKLQKAVLDSDIKKIMDMEDGLLDELEDMDRVIEDLTQKNEDLELEKERVKLEKEQIKLEKEQEIENLKKELEEMRKLLKKKK